nr:ubiquitin-activating enzyme E1 1-like [Tanacetum cinerariifolium]
MISLSSREIMVYRSCLSLLRSSAFWRRYELKTTRLSQELVEQLRLIMEPTLTSKLQGDYKTGKRINMKKDDDTNYHMDFIAGLANMRAKNYSIPDVDKLRAKFIVGRIILAIATSTTMAIDSTKESIRTGTLSKRWRHLWPQIPNLVFEYNVNDGDRIYVICWKNLRTLTITFGRFDDDLFRRIISGSQVLETLVLCSCYGFEDLDISNDSVKNFVICGYSSEMDTLQINAPHIESLTIKVDSCAERSFATCNEFSAASVANLPAIF